MFYPPFSVVIHAGLFGLYIASASYQGGSDESDPKHPQSGAPWYLAKNCSVAKDPANIPYCKQAKALFAITIIIMYAVSLAIYLLPFANNVDPVFSTSSSSVSASMAAS